jgi:DNA-binding XRE family transcriptional regulator
MTTRELATKLGLTLENLELLESGFTKPSPELRRVLMAYFGCPFEDLFEMLSIQMDDRL